MPRVPEEDSLNRALWWVYFTTALILCLTPGPAVLLVISSSLRNGPHRALASVLGILTANAFYFALSATSIGSLLSSYSFVAGRASEWLRQPRYAAWTNRVSGTLLVTASGGLAMLRRD